MESVSLVPLVSERDAPGLRTPGVTGHCVFLYDPGFNQGLLADSSVARFQGKKAFSTSFGLYQFTTLPFGLFGVPATFQRLMDRVLRLHAAYAAWIM